MNGWIKHVIKPPGKGAVNSAQAHDWDGDGAIDVIASYDGHVVLLKGPEWREFPVCEFVPGRSRVQPRGACIHSTIMDVDGDGDMDFCGSNQTVFWLECPADPFSGDPWAYRTIDDEVLGTHCLLEGDVNRDGKLDLIANSGRGAPQTKFPYSLTWLEVPKDPHGAKSWVRHVFADRDAPGGSHYAGLGDVNGDRRPDISFAAKGGKGFENGQWFAWWEQPEDPGAVWKKHLLAAGEVGATNILPADLDGDGQTDFLASRGHGKGVLWFKGPEFEKIEIDPGIVFTHCLVATDLDGDGDIDGATCSKDPGGHTRWYENDGKGKFTIHTICED
ncbi:MAG: VCBS repeat-containing protein, partial [Akkermansiaceae bacterium]|nr:VCBS repeat-containing protein [Akkermansiaceae bacterium]